MGRLKLNFQDLFYLEVSDLNLILKGHEIDKRDDWERTRMGTTISLLPHLKKGAKLDPSQVMPLPWETKGDKNDFIERAKIMTEKLKARDNVKVRD